MDRGVTTKRRKFLPKTPVEGHILKASEFQDLDLPPGFALDNSNARPEELIVDEDLELGQGPYLPGDMWDDPPPQPGQGSGQGQEPGDPDDEEIEEVGEEPGQGTGSGPGNGGQHIDIPIELYGQMLAEKLELRNLRQVDSKENERTRSIRHGAKNSSSGDIVYDQTAQVAFEKGWIIAKRKKIKNPTTAQLLKWGVSSMNESELITQSRIEEPLPDFDAVMVHVADVSGSMGPEHRKAEYQMVANTKAILKHFYKNVKHVFVICDTEAREVSEKEFFNTWLGGGTDMKNGVRLGRDILEKKYPASRFNRFMHLYSDGGDFDADGAVNEAKQIVEKIEYFGYVHVDPYQSGLVGGGFSGMSDRFKQFSEEKKGKNVGFAPIDSQLSSVLNAIKIFYGKNGGM